MACHDGAAAGKQGTRVGDESKSREGKVQAGAGQNCPVLQRQHVAQKETNTGMALIKRYGSKERRDAFTVRSLWTINTTLHIFTAPLTSDFLITFPNYEVTVLSHNPVFIFLGTCIKI